MAPRTPRIAAKATVVNGRVIVPELHPRDADTKFTGGEPVFEAQPDQDRRKGELVRAFNWYSRYYDRKMAKEQLAAYAEYQGSPQIAKQIRRVDDREVIVTMGWLARLFLRGLDLTEAEQVRLHAEFQRLVKVDDKSDKTEVVVVKVSNKPNVQEIMRERAAEAAGDLEGEIDNFILAGAKSNQITVNPVSILTAHNVLPQHVSSIIDQWKRHQQEFEAVLAGDDVQLNEAYRAYSKHQLKALIKFCEAVISGIGSYISVKKVSRAPRKRKAVSPEKQASKLKFLKSNEELKLTSVHPAKIIGASEVWAFDVAKRKLHYYVADASVGSLGIKGTTILGFDMTNSGVKTVRKPQDVLKKLMAAGKPAARKVFKEINAVHAQPNGRTNENLVILRVS